MNLLKSWAAAAAMMALSGAAQAALVGRGGGLIYDATPAPGPAGCSDQEAN